MSDFEESTLQVSYQGADTAVHTLEKAFTAALREMTQNRPQGPERNGLQSIRSLDEQNKQLVSVKLDRQDVKAIATELQGYGVDFSIMKNRESTAHTLFFKAKDSAVIENALHRYLEKAHREMEHTPGRQETPTPAEKEANLDGYLKKMQKQADTLNEKLSKNIPPQMPEMGIDL